MKKLVIWQERPNARVWPACRALSEPPLQSLTRRAWQHDDFCGICMQGGELMMCDGSCWRSFHVACVGVPFVSRCAGRLWLTCGAVGDFARGRLVLRLLQSDWHIRWRVRWLVCGLHCCARLIAAQVWRVRRGGQDVGQVRWRLAMVCIRAADAVRRRCGSCERVFHGNCVGLVAAAMARDFVCGHCVAPSLPFRQAPPRPDEETPPQQAEGSSCAQ